jgi:TRAP-type C4-dicarboxylate transport system permease small subunit
MSAARISRAFDLLLKLGGALAGAVVVVVMLVVCLKVFLRYGLGQGLIGVDQLSGTMLLYITFLGAAWVLSREEHVTIDIVIGRASPRVQRILMVVNSLVCALVCLLVAVYGTMEALYSWKRGFLVAAEIEFPRAYNLMIIPIGCFLLWVQFMRRAWLAYHSSSPPKPNL